MARIKTSAAPGGDLQSATRVQKRSSRKPKPQKPELKPPLCPQCVGGTSSSGALDTDDSRQPLCSINFSKLKNETLRTYLRTFSVRSVPLYSNKRDLAGAVCSHFAEQDVTELDVAAALCQKLKKRKLDSQPPDVKPIAKPKRAKKNPHKILAQNGKNQLGTLPAIPEEGCAE